MYEHDEHDEHETNSNGEKEEVGSGCAEGCIVLIAMLQLVVILWMCLALAMSIKDAVEQHLLEHTDPAPDLFYYY